MLHQMRINPLKQRFCKTIFAISLCALPGCASVYQLTDVRDAMLDDNKLVLLLEAEEWHSLNALHEDTAQRDKTAIGIAMVFINDSNTNKLHLLGALDATTSFSTSRWLASSNACFVSTSPGISLGKYVVTKSRFGLAREDTIHVDESHDIFATQDRRSFFILEKNPRTIRSDNLQSITNSNAKQCLRMLLEKSPEKLSVPKFIYYPNFAFCISDDLSAFGMSDGQNAYFWDWERSSNSVAIPKGSEFGKMIAIQKVDGRILTLFHRIDGVVTLLDESGEVITQTQWYGEEFTSTPKFQCVVFIKKSDKNGLVLKKWFPNRKEEFYQNINCESAFKSLYEAWKTK